VNLLLDSHTLLWLMETNPALSGTAISLIADPANKIHLSMASIWEIAIKVGLKKLGLFVPFSTFLATAVTGYGLTVVPITEDDCVRYETLPFPNPRHRDPFDRMIVTQALQNNLSVVGNDVAFDVYGVPRIW
jgi:PIN domain nuclease of toxin-antitoxin system